MRERLFAVLRFAASHLRLTFFTLLLLYVLGWLAVWSVQSSWLHIQWIQMRYGTLDHQGVRDALLARQGEEILLIQFSLRDPSGAVQAAQNAQLISELRQRGLRILGTRDDQHVSGCFPKSVVLELASRPEMSIMYFLTPATIGGVRTRSLCE